MTKNNIDNPIFTQLEKATELGMVDGGSLYDILAVSHGPLHRTLRIRWERTGHKEVMTLPPHADLRKVLTALVREIGEGHAPIVLTGDSLRVYQRRFVEASRRASDNGDLLFQVRLGRYSMTYRMDTP